MTRSKLSTAAIVSISLVSGCTGVIGDEPGVKSQNTTPSAPNNPGSPGTGTSGDCSSTQSIVVPIRRMNDLQYRNTVRDLFGGVVTGSPSFPETIMNGGYSTMADSNTVSQLGAERIQDAAESTALQVIDHL